MVIFVENEDVVKRVIKSNSGRDLLIETPNIVVYPTMIGNLFQQKIPVVFFITKDKKAVLVTKKTFGDIKSPEEIEGAVEACLKKAKLKKCEENKTVSSLLGVEDMSNVVYCPVER